MSAMSLRAKILDHALPLLPAHSFTRQTLSLALCRLEQNHPDFQSEPVSDSVLDTLFGDGQAGLKALVQRWEEAGTEEMLSNSLAEGSKTRKMGAKLRSRLSYSAELGEHLVEAYGLLSAPSSATTLPIPSIPKPIRQLLHLRMPPIYTPPGMAARGALSLGDTLSAIAARSGGRLPLPIINPLGPLSYGWRIADAALLADERNEGIKRGVMNEPVGAGPEWYTTRLSLALAYLQAESHLLSPYPPLPPGTVYASEQPNPHLPTALQALDRNLGLFDRSREGIKGVEEGVGSFGGYLEFLARSVGGLWRSRYF